MGPRSPAASLGDRLLHLAGDRDTAGYARLVDAFRLFLTVHVVVRSWTWVGEAELTVAMRVAVGGVVSAGALLTLVARHRRLGLAVIAAGLVTKLLWVFPLTSNHFYIELLSVLYLAGFDTDDDGERELALLALRWTTVIVLFWTGAQKAWYGTYFHGDYLGYQVATTDHFAQVLGPLVPDDELARVRALQDPMEPADVGPYRIDSTALVVAANAAWIAEVLLALLLLFRRTRGLAVVGLFGLVVLVEAAARELFFGALFLNLVLLFAPPGWNRRLLPAWFALYAFLIAVLLGIGPAFWFN